MTTRANSPAFSDDLEFIGDSVAWIRARCRRIEQERRLRERDPYARETEGVLGPTERTGHKENRRRISVLKEVEDGLRAQLDARLAANRSNGPNLGFELVLEESGLADDAFARAVLLLGTIAAIGGDAADAIDRVSSRGYVSGINCETIWAFLEMPLAEQVRSRAAFLPTAPLMKHGLVTLVLGVVSSPADLPTSTIEVTSLAFSRIVGVPAFAVASLSDSEA